MAVQIRYPERPDLEVAGFEWDQGNRDKCRKHGVSLAAIERLFAGPLLVFRDSAHSRVEERFKAIGMTDSGRGVLVVFTLREQSGAMFVRALSARYMHRKEVEHYEKAVEEIAKAEKR
jgi:uncharacterized DUF497 family protein